MEVDFPRGEEKDLTPLEMREITDKAKHSLFNDGGELEQPKKRQKTEFKIALLTTKQLKKEMKLLGIVSKVNELDLEISLPNQLVGYCSILDISPTLSALVETEDIQLQDLYKVGDLCVVKVLANEDKIELSLEIEYEELAKGMTVQASVKSQEDHGCILQIGEYNGFISGKYPVGKTMLVTVTKTGRVVQCKDERGILNKSQEINMNQLFPGMMVKVKITAIHELGLFVSFLGLFEGYIPFTHFDFQPQVGMRLDARILYLDPNGNVYFSVLEHIINQVIISPRKRGEIIKVSAEKIQDKFGVWVNERGFIHISNLSDTRTEKIKWKLGAEKEARVIGYCAVDNVTLFSTKESTLKQKYMSLEDITIGEIVKGAVVKVEDFGVIVKLTDSIQALCPTMHLSDIVLKNPAKLFKEGQNKQFRVLFTDVEKNKCILTAKKSLIQLEKIVTDYTVEVGDINTAVITAVKEFGCIVNFFNNVKALVPVAELSQTKTSLNAFKVGQTVKCRVISVDSENEKMRCSFIIHGSASVSNQIGAKLNCDLVQVVENGVMVKEGDTKAFVPLEHLADNNLLAKAFFERLKNAKKSNLGQATIFSINEKKGIHIATLKPMLQTIPEKIELGDVLPLVVKSIYQNKLVFVTCGSFEGIIPVAEITDGYLADISSVLVEGQTVIGKCIETGKYTFSMRNSVIGDISEFESKFLQGIFNTKSRMASLTGKKPWKSEHGVGKIVEAEVESIVPGLGVAIKVTSKVKGFVTTTESMEVGDTKKVTIIDYDEDSRIVDAVLSISEPVNVPKVGELGEGKIIHLKDDYAVVESAYGVVFVLNKEINGSKSKYQLSQNVKFLIQSIGERIIAIVPSTANVVKIIGKKILKNPVGNNSMDNVATGNLIRGIVTSVKGTQANIRLADNLRGRIHVTEIFDDYSKADLLKPLKALKIGQEIEAKIIGFHNPKTHSFLAVTHNQSASQMVIELSIKPSILKTSGVPVRITKDNLLKDQSYYGVIEKIEKSALWIQISAWVLGKVDALKVSADPLICSDLPGNFKVGQMVNCFVISANDGHCDLSLIKPAQLKVNDEVNVKIIRKDAVKGWNCYLGPGVYGRIKITETKGDAEVGSIIKVKVLNTGAKTDLTCLESRPSFNEGDIVNGIITAVNDKGCFVELSNDAYGRVKIAELSDSFIKEWKDVFEVGQNVKTKILSIDEKQNQIELTLKESKIDPAKKKIALEELHVGQVVAGEVKKIEKFGMFILVDDTTVRGLCHITEVSENTVKDISKLYEIGDRVQAYILKIDLEKQRLSLSLKASHFENYNSDGPDSEHEQIEENNDISDASSESEGESEMEVDDITSNHSEIQDSPENFVPVSENMKPLDLSDFSWSNDVKRSAANSDSDSDESSDDDDERKVPSRKERLRQLEAKEREIEMQEERLLDPTAEPESIDDFERLVIASPNDSMAWIKYMAFQLELAETEKARKIADRALSTINFREEQERMNVFIAYLNLENNFGSPESLQNCFARACQVCEPKKMHIQFLQVLLRGNQKEEAEELLNKMIKKFRESCKIWLLYIKYKLEQGEFMAARDLLTRSTKSLPKRKHIKIISKFGQMEFKIGDPERGRTVFEGLLSNYPKKSDLWSVYLDMEVRVGVVDICRRLFERILTMKWSTKKMKFFFKKYLEFEKTKGTPDGVNHVKESAMRYVETLS